MVIQINDLLSCQAELDNANTSADAKYKLLSAKLAREAEAQNSQKKQRHFGRFPRLGTRTIGNEWWKAVHTTVLSQIRVTSMIEFIVMALQWRQCGLC
jgi:hypothetical protein